MARLEDFALGARFVRGVATLWGRPLGLEQARAELRSRLERREGDFLGLMQRAVFAQPASPYRRLLELAGCEYGDLERLVQREGLEGALRALQRRGVYLTAEELKGRRPAIRGSASVQASVAQLRNPGLSGWLPANSSGSGGGSTWTSIDLASVRAEAVNCQLVLAARGGLRWQHAHWGVPGGAAIARLLQFSLLGGQAVQWFTQVDSAAAGLHPRYRWSVRGLRWASRLGGLRLSRPIYAPIDDPCAVVTWMEGVLRGGGIPHLWTFASPAVRLAEAAEQAGVVLEGAQLTVGGEPITPARLEATRRIGASAVPVYATTESGMVGYGCLAPDRPDDLHLLQDLHALIRAESDEFQSALRPGTLLAGTLLLTSLRPTARLILLNASLGDQAEVVERACGCAMAALGWRTHLHSVRSFEKLTAGGMTFQDGQVIDVLERVLPARFGGGPTDYQLLEEESEEGEPILRLRVHPRLGALDERELVDAFLGALGGGSGAERVMALQWRQAHWLRVERESPLATGGGKVLHLHRSNRGWSTRGTG
jgi:hypothetical protein